MSRGIKVRAGDFAPGSVGKIVYSFFGRPTAISLQLAGHFFPKSIPLSKVLNVEIVAQDSVGQSGNAILRGAIGEVVFGPVGAIVGAISSSNRRQTEVMFRADFDDGLTLLASSDFESFACLKSAVFAKEQIEPLPTKIVPQVPVSQPKILSQPATALRETTDISAVQRAPTKFGRLTLQDRISKISENGGLPRSESGNGASLRWTRDAGFTPMRPGMAISIGVTVISLLLAPSLAILLSVYAAIFGAIFFFKGHKPQSKTVSVNLAVVSVLSVLVAIASIGDERTSRGRDLASAPEKHTDRTGISNATALESSKALDDYHDLPAIGDPMLSRLAACQYARNVVRFSKGAGKRPINGEVRGSFPRCVGGNDIRIVTPNENGPHPISFIISSSYIDEAGAKHSWEVSMRQGFINPPYTDTILTIDGNSYEDR